MGSIRPLITITILVIVGAYLYVKINEGPAKPAAGTSDAWQNAPPIDVPPAGQGAPAWTGTAMTPAPAAAAEVAATEPAVPNPLVSTGTDVSAAANSNSAVSVPAVPAMPELPATAETTAPAQIPATLPTELPANIPTATYPDQTTPSAASATSNISGVPAASLTAIVPGTTAPGVAELTVPPISQAPLPPAASLSSSQQLDAGNNALPSEAPLPAEAAVNPLRQSQPPAAVDRYAIGNETARQAAVTSSAISPEANPLATNQAQGSFAGDWPVIQAALDRGELAKAHQLLSPWHNAPTLTPADAQKVETLLGQLAGTVIYSTEHQLEPAHVVKPGETLETIAKECGVPWQLLAKINGIPASDQVRPGQELKVVRGPFSAVVDVQRNEMALTVDGRYAGKFAVNAQPGVELPAGDWQVANKLESESRNGQISATSVQQVVLQNASAAGQPGIPVVIGTEPAIAGGEIGASGLPTATQQAPQYFIKASSEDVQEIADILSVGSHVMIRR